MAENSAFSDLKAQYRVFVEEYCTGEESGRPFCAVKAAEVAGYSHPENYGVRLISRPDIRAAIEERMAVYSMGKMEVIKRLNDIAAARYGDIVKRNEQGGMSFDYDELEKNRRFIKSFGYDSNGLPKVEFYDSHAALRDIGKAHGIFKDGLEVSGPGGGPVDLTIRFVDVGEEMSQGEG